MDNSIFSEKQLEAFNNSSSRLNIFTGAVRSGKSFIAMLRWLEYIRSGPSGPLLMVGKSMQTIKRNIILPLQDIVGNRCRYKIGLGEVDLFGRKIHVVSGNDERSESKLRGSEFAGALVDEATILPESFFQMLLSRLSVRDSKCFITTNPDNPSHWLKRNFIDRASEIDCSVFEFQLTDNPSLSDEYKSALKSEFTGLWYERFVLGKWVAGEGSVFSFFDRNIHVMDMPISQATRYQVGIDFGIANPCCFVLLAINDSASPRFWVEKEYYFDSRKEQYQKSDVELVNDLRKFCEGIFVEKIYIDPSAASLKVELRRQGFTVIDAENDVNESIQKLSQLMLNGNLKICSNCNMLIQEIEGYSWDLSWANRGIDKPKKVNDHSVDALRYCCTGLYSYIASGNMTESDAEAMERVWYRPMSRYS